MSDLDVDYFRKKLKVVLRDLPSYTREELSLELLRLSLTAQPDPIPEPACKHQSDCPVDFCPQKPRTKLQCYAPTEH